MADDDLSLATESEIGQLAELRAALSEDLKTLASAGRDFRHTTGDIFMLRVLRGNDRNIPLACEWYRNFLQLREANGFDEIHRACAKSPTPWASSNMPRVQEVSKWYHQQFDEEKLRSPDGHLIWYDGLGSINSEELLANKDVFLEFFRSACERRLECLDRLSHEQQRLVKIVRIMDFDGFSLSQYGRQMARFNKDTLVPMLTKSAAETVQRVLVVNAPWFVVKLFKAFQVTLPARINARTFIYGKDFMQQQECLTHVGTEKLVELMASKQAAASEGDDASLSGSDRLIPAGQFMERYIAVEKGQTVSWVFSLGAASAGEGGRGIAGRVLDKTVGEGTDVQFSAIRIGSVSSLTDMEVQEEVLALPAMVDASSGEVSGSHAVSAEGTVLLRWSNYHSWVRAKMLTSFEIKVS